MAGLADALSVTNADGGTFTFTVAADASTGGVAVQSLTWNPIVATTRQPKGDQSGLFDTFAYIQGMLIEATGVINGTDGTDYWARRAQLAAAIQPAAGSQADYDHGTVFATFGGTAYRAGVTLEQWSAPLDLTGDHTAPYTIQWLNRAGYWTRVSDSAQVRL